MQLRRIATAAFLVQLKRAFLARMHTACTWPQRRDPEEINMIVLGIILLLIGYFTHLSILYTIGGILVVIGVVLWILGAVGRPVGGRKVWF